MLSSVIKGWSADSWQGVHGGSNRKAELEAQTAGAQLQDEGLQSFCLHSHLLVPRKLDGAQLQKHSVGVGRQPSPYFHLSDLI